MYSRGMTTREIKSHLEEIYQVEVSPNLISTVTEGVLEEVVKWQSRPLDSVYPIVYLVFTEKRFLACLSPMVCVFLAFAKV